MSVKEILQAQGCLYPDTMDAPQGWVCPKCGRVYSPLTPMCLYCGDEVEDDRHGGKGGHGGTIETIYRFGMNEVEE